MKEVEFTFKLLSSLDKVFQDQEPLEQKDLPLPSGFQNETTSFQAAYRMTGAEPWVDFRVEIISPLKDHIRVRQVRQVPVQFPIYDNCDTDYLRTSPGLYPDLLSVPHLASLYAFPGRWGSLWFDVQPDENVHPGVYPIEIRLIEVPGGKIAGETGGKLLACRTQRVEILQGILPDQRLIHTKWLYCDTLAEYYRVPVFSEKHWSIIENFVRHAVEAGINMILMPTHTPPVNTYIGGERLTTQLVDISIRDGQYIFDMTNVHRWIAMCRRCGVMYYEVAHLFTQWGCRHAPKIVTSHGGKEERIFGWETDSRSPEYQEFLAEYLRALNDVFCQEGIADYVRWHISDEPSEEDLSYYLEAKKTVRSILPDAVIMDALEEVRFYTEGIVEHPVIPVHAADGFLKKRVSNLWLYYSCDDYIDVCNHFIAMPSVRCRIFAIHLFKYQIEGFLHWGYNFYNTARSQYAVDPYASTDADGRYPAGDAFQVYPGPHGEPEDSIRLMVFLHALQDLRAFEWLASLTSREYTLSLIEEEAGEPVSFHRYPRDMRIMLEIRRKINEEILRRSFP